MADLGPNLIGSRQHLVDFGPHLVDSRPILVDSGFGIPGECFFETGGNLAKVGRVRATFGRFPGQHWSSLVEGGLTSIEFGPRVSILGFTWPNLPRNWAVGPSSAEFEQCRPNFGRSRPGFGPNSTGFDRMHPDLARGRRAFEEFAWPSLQKPDYGNLIEQRGTFSDDAREPTLQRARARACGCRTCTHTRARARMRRESCAPPEVQRFKQTLSDIAKRWPLLAQTWPNRANAGRCLP